jgi:hypothetical protein
MDPPPYTAIEMLPPYSAEKPAKRTGASATNQAARAVIQAARASRPILETAQPPVPAAVAAQAPRAAAQPASHIDKRFKYGLCIVIAIISTIIPIPIIVKYYQHFEAIPYAVAVMMGLIQLPTFTYGIAKLSNIKNTLFVIFTSMTIYYFVLLWLGFIEFETAPGHLTFAMISISGGFTLLCLIGIFATSSYLRNYSIRLGFMMSTAYFAGMMIIPMIAYTQPREIKTALIIVPGGLCLISILVCTYEKKLYWFLMVKILSALYTIGYTVFTMYVFYDSLSSALKICFPALTGFSYLIAHCISLSVMLKTYNFSTQMISSINFIVISLYFIILAMAIIVFGDVSAMVMIIILYVMGMLATSCLICPILNALTKPKSTIAISALYLLQHINVIGFMAHHKDDIDKQLIIGMAFLLTNGILVCITAIIEAIAYNFNHDKKNIMIISFSPIIIFTNILFAATCSFPHQPCTSNVFQAVLVSSSSMLIITSFVVFIILLVCKLELIV